jgi:23S rRNA (adenine2503-C2)-methyltransferase
VTVTDVSLSSRQSWQRPGGPTRYGATRVEIAELLAGEPRYRVDQIWDGLYAGLRDPTEMTNLPRRVRAEVDRLLPSELTAVAETVSDAGDTVKFLSAIDGDRRVSPRPRRGTPAQQRRLFFMGIGEPLANEAAVWAATERIHEDLGLSARHITVSTVGVVPGIRALTARRLPVTLAVSIHAANDALRDELVPPNRRYPLDAVVSACQHIDTTGRRVSFEWAMIDGVNDRPRDAAELAELARRLRPAAHVNLIPLNPTPGWPTTGSPASRVRQFRDQLGTLGVGATVRRNRGTDIDAACGQLAARHRAGGPANIG